MGSIATYDSLITLPMKIGILVAVSSAVLTIPLVFDFETAQWFNAKFVYMEVPREEEHETLLEVGAWTWSWNEPVIGTASFVLLCMQFCRGQMVNLRLKPYTEKMMRLRADRAVRQFPMYKPKFVRDFTLVDL